MAASTKVRAKRLLEPGEVALRRARRYTWVRRGVLGLSVAWFLAGPVWWLASIDAASAGVADGGRWLPVGRILLHLGLPAVLGAPWSLRLWSLEVMDPLAGLGLLATGAFGLQAALAVAPALALTAVFGRFFCGWLCPYIPLVAVSGALRVLLLRWGLRPIDLRLPRQTPLVLLGALCVASALAGQQLAPLVYPPSVLGRELFRAVFQGTLGAGAVFLVLAFTFDTVVSPGGFCRSLCPGGALFSLLARRSPVQVQRRAPACTDCGACDAICYLGQKPMTDVVDSGCERCGKCVAACPTGALRMSWKGREP